MSTSFSNTSSLESIINTLAERDIRSGNIHKAQQDLKALLDKHPNSSRSVNNLGIISWIQNDKERALELFVQSCENDPANSDAFQNLTQAATQLGRLWEFQHLLDSANFHSESLDESLCTTVEIKGCRWKMFTNDLLAHSIIRKSEWEPHIETFIKSLPSTSVMIDVGANFGYHSIISAKHLQKIYSYEPQPQVFELLKWNVQANALANIELFPNAVGECSKTVNIPRLDLTQELNAGDTSLSNNDEFAVACVAIDDRHFDRVDVIKMDVQGYEIFALQGMITTIAMHRPYLIIEVEGFQLQKFNYNEELLFRYIREILNYEIYYLEFEYPADHLCVHKDNCEAFEREYSKYISVHRQDNKLNHNVHHGVTKKLTMI